MVTIIQKIKEATTMEDMDNLRDDVLSDRNNESLQAWQRKYRGMKVFRKPADKGYKYKMI